jgi:hypothetical protein
MPEFDSDSFALDLLSVIRGVASNTDQLTRLMETVFAGPEGDSEFAGLLRAVTRIRYVEKAILDALSGLTDGGPIGAAEIYKDISRSVIMAGLVYSEASAGRLRCYYPHLLSEADIERIRLTVKTGMNKGDISEAAAYLLEVENRLSGRRKPQP